MEHARQATDWDTWRLEERAVKTKIESTMAFM